MACHGIVRVLWGLAAAGRKGGGGHALAFGAAALQHHQQQEGRVVAAVGVPRRFLGCNICTTTG